LDYGFPVGDALGSTIIRICSALGLPFELGEVPHPEATISLLADLVQLGAMRRENGVYRWIPAIVGKWRHADFKCVAQNGVPRLRGSVRVGPALTSDNSVFVRSLPPSAFTEYQGERGTHVCYIPDMEGQLAAIKKGSVKDVAGDTTPTFGLHSQNLFNEVSKTLGKSHRPLAVFLDRHVALTNDPHGLAELLRQAMPVPDTELSRYWFNTTTRQSHFVGGKAGTIPDKRKAKLEALLAA